MCILKGFPTALKSTTSFPFGMWFANPDTLYVADEGNGDSTYSTAAPATDGLRNITGRVNRDGTVTIWRSPRP